MDSQNLKPIDLSGIINIALFYLCLLNLGFFIDLKITKLPYIPLFGIFILVLIYKIRYINFKKNKWYILLSIVITISLLRIEIPYYFSNILFVLIFALQIGYLNIANKATIIRSKVGKLLNTALVLTLFLSILHVFFGSGKKGWIWPINIALQEITLLGLLYSKILLYGLKRSIPYLLFFLVLVLFRESGKATFLSVLIGVYLIRGNFKVRNRLRFQNKIFHLIFIVQIGVVFLSTWLNSYLNTLPVENILNYYLNRRLALINDGWEYLVQNVKYFLIGGGFDVNNYFEQHPNITFKNAPQLFILTSGVFGGVLFTISLILSLSSMYKEKIRLNPNRNAVILLSYFISLATINTFHEYINNPFLFFSISMVLISYNSRNESSKSVNNYSNL